MKRSGLWWSSSHSSSTTPRLRGQKFFLPKEGSIATPNWYCFAIPSIQRAGWPNRQRARFYCPEDEKVYLDLGFLDELNRRFGAPGQFAQAYVVAHEIGHHVQKLLGIESKARAAQQRSPQSAKAISVRLELQADCFAGVWSHSTDQRHLLESGDVESALGAAAAVGDDRLQRMSSGHVHPESFTHGSSAQRTEWFQRGFNGGSVESCNSFTN